MDEKKNLYELIDEAALYCDSISEDAKKAYSDLINRMHTFADDFVDFRMILNGINEQFYITDASEKTVFVNTAYCNASKLQPEQLLGKTITTLVEKDHLFQNPIIPKVIREKKEQQEIAYVQGQEKPVCLIGIPIFDAEGTLRYAVSNDYRPEDISSLQYHFARFEEQKELQKKNAELDYYRQYINTQRDYGFADPQMMKIVDLARGIGNTDVTVLITGESGTGKEVIADLLCHSSNRSEQPFIKVNCAAIPENLIESELFGYEKGAFTGADKNGKIGMMELADKGTLFLDEIGDIPLPLQTKLLRAIQEKKIRRVGGLKEISIDIRIIAATNKDLKNEIREGRFREDLYYRLNVLPIKLPALRDRPKDIPLLIDQFLKEYTTHYRKHIRLDEEAVACLQQYPWPGNIRELKNIMERLVVINTSGEITKPVVQAALGIFVDTVPPPAPAVSVPRDLNLKSAKEKLEIEYINAALSQHGSKRQAAKALGIDHSTLVLKCQKYQIH